MILSGALKFVSVLVLVLVGHYMKPLLAKKSPFRVAIVGGGYAGLSCAFFASKFADTVQLFGLEPLPGEGVCASTVSVSPFPGLVALHWTSN
jgi:ribulose 1,5-bisphosphate synthetase/thiazole synthase